ncbi:hypothetical protein V2W30_35555 [Streptomyces sp. Q6]|uniref:Uncharacterized protein n=1 Tax=Streptomyces citrinus TaxID=3118173 RepID=A0ACD5ALM3_9ACTN
MFAAAGPAHGIVRQRVQRDVLLPAYEQVGGGAAQGHPGDHAEDAQRQAQGGQSRVVRVHVEDRSGPRDDPDARDLGRQRRVPPAAVGARRHGPGHGGRRRRRQALHQQPPAVQGAGQLTQRHARPDRHPDTTRSGPVLDGEGPQPPGVDQQPRRTRQGRERVPGPDGPHRQTPLTGPADQRGHVVLVAGEDVRERSAPGGPGPVRPRPTATHAPGAAASAFATCWAIHA